MCTLQSFESLRSELPDKNQSTKFEIELLQEDNRLSITVFSG
jgi:hypothetical protein